MTSPSWVLLLYYCFFGITLVYGVIITWKGLIHRFLSILTILLSIAFQFLFLLNSIGRPIDETEFEFLLKGLIEGDIIPWVLLLCMAYLIYWWMRVFKVLLKS